MTLTELIESEVLDPNIHKGWMLLKGRQLFWWFNPTKRGFYAIYPYLEGGELGRPRYVDPCLTKVKLIFKP